MKSWADRIVAGLQTGAQVAFRPKGHSMEPRIMSDQLVTVEPCAWEAAKVGDVVLCHVAGADYLHLVVEIGPKGLRISNQKGRVNGWTKIVYGRMVP